MDHLEPKQRMPSAHLRPPSHSTEDLREKSTLLLRRGLDERSLDMVRAAMEMDPAAAARGWRQRTHPTGMQMETLALPEAARMGWARGVAELARAGADPNQADADRQGLDFGRPPIAEAVSRADYETAQALFEAGAAMAPLGEMVWAASCRARRLGVGEGLAALDWMKERGFDLWTSPETANQSCFLFAGSVAAAGPELAEAWDRALFDGATAEADPCLWHHLFALGAGSDKSAWMCRKYIGSGPGSVDRATQVLAWALSGGCPVAAGAAAAELPLKNGWRAAGGAAIEAAAGDRLSEEGVSAAGQFEAARALWRVAGLALGGAVEPLEAACAHAMSKGKAGLFEGIMEVARLDPLRVLERWSRRDRREDTPGEVAERGRESCVVAAMARLVDGDGGAGKDGYEAARGLFLVAYSGRTGGRGDGGKFELLFSQAQAKALAKCAGGLPESSTPTRPRL